MHLTTKSKFAVTALIDIVMHSNHLPGSDGILLPMKLQNISQRHEISLSYLEQLFVKLRRGGIVKSYKGPGGGYVLAKAAQQLTIAEIIHAVDENLDARSCRGNGYCRNRQEKCLTHDLWHSLTNHVHEYLAKITLYDVVQGKKI